MKITVFSDMTSLPTLPSNLLLSSSVSTLKMDAGRYTETLASIYRNTPCFTREDRQAGFQNVEFSYFVTVH
jgi:hypothetical protein